MKLKKSTGFTLIELLIVIGIIGVLAAVVLVSLNRSRQGGRDARRISDVRQIMTAMQLYFNDNSGFPGPDSASDTGPNPDDGDPDWSTYLGLWPVAPTPADNPEGVTDCDATNNQYTYTQLNSGSEYSVTFCLGAPVGQYAPGVHTLNSEGIN